MQSRSTTASQSTQCALPDAVDGLTFSYLNGTDEWVLFRDKDNALFSRDVDERDGVLFRTFLNFQGSEFSDVKIFDGARLASIKLTLQR